MQLKDYLANRTKTRQEVERERNLARIPVKLLSGKMVTLSPGGQNPLIKQIIEEFCPRFAPGAPVTYIGDAESKFLHLEAAYLEGLGIVIAPSAKMPDVVVHDTKRNWLMLVEAVTSAGAVDWKRRKELKELFKGCKAGLVFVTAFETDQGLKVVRADQIGASGMITSQILEHILKARLVIVDLSFHNPNVFYELAIRHACKLPVVHIIRKSDKIPFDVNQARAIGIIRRIIYTLVPQLETFRSQIATFVRQALADPTAASNPLTVFCPGFQVSLPS